jgi:transglutaminase-like putative cysteine protease
MRKRIVFMMLCAFSALAATAQETYKAAEIPASLRAGANAVVRNSETELSMLGPDNVIKTVKEAVTVLNKAGVEHANIALYYNKSTTIKAAKGIILDANGSQIAKFGLNNFMDQSAISDFSLYEDDRIKYYIPSITTYPFTIVYEYEIRARQNLVLPDWYANRWPDLSIEKSSYTFNYNPADKIIIKAYNYIGQAEERQLEKLKSLTWAVKDLPAFKQEPYAPAADLYRTYVKIAPEQFAFYRTKGHATNWNELGKWIYTDLIKSRQNLDPAVISEMKSLVSELKTDKERAKKIYEYMQHKTRYISVQIGLGGFQPMFANDVQRLGYGDCKALVNYMQSLLKAVNISSIYCVVNAGNNKQQMDPDFASMDQGNHVILCLPFEKDTTWLECTSQTVPFGFLGDFTDDRTVLACTEEGGKLLRTPALKTEMNEIKRIADLNVDLSGNIIGSLNTTFKGSQYDTYESIINKPLTEQIKTLKRYYDVDNINFEKVKITQDKSENPTTTENLSIKIASYVPVNNKSAYLIVNPFNKLPVTRTVNNRKLALYINRGYTDYDEITYHLPEGFDVEYKPKDLEIKNGYGSYSSEITKKGNLLVYTRKFVLNNGTHPAKDYESFAGFMNEVANADRGKVILKLIPSAQ